MVKHTDVFIRTEHVFRVCVHLNRVQEGEHAWKQRWDRRHKGDQEHHPDWCFVNIQMTDPDRDRNRYRYRNRQHDPISISLTEHWYLTAIILTGETCSSYLLV